MSGWSSAYLICGICVRIESYVGDPTPYLPRAMGDFAAPGSMPPEVTVVLRDDEMAQADPLKLFFPSQFVLSPAAPGEASRGKAGISEAPGSPPTPGEDLCFARAGFEDRCLGVISPTGSEAEIGLPSLARSWRVAEEEEAVREALQAFVKACLQYRLLQGGGTLLHASAVSRGGGGFVFAGHTRSGKSTLSRAFPVEETLGDDLVAARGRGGGFVLFGTPWPGREGGAVAYGGVPLQAVFNLHPAPRTEVFRQSPGEALAELLSNAPRLGHPGEESKLLEIFSSLVSAVPIFSMSLRLGDDVVPYLERIAREEGGENRTVSG